VVEGNEAAQHQHKAEDDHEVDRNPDLAVGDHPRDPLRIIYRGDRMDEVPHHPEEGADNCRRTPEPKQ
jgi:hypothetical protein